MTAAPLPPPAAPLDLAAALLGSAHDVVLLAHCGPDADALGSALAVGLALRERGAQVVVSFGDEPFAVPRSLAWLPGVDALVRPPAAVPTSPQVAAAFDTSSPDRLGVLGPLVSGAQAFVVVDHHAAGEAFGDVAVIDAAAPATAVLVLELLDRMGAPLSVDIATCLYAGLLTDTGGFRFAATTAATHRAAARLHEAGVQHDEVARRLYDDEPFAVLRLLGAALDGAVIEPDALGGRGLVRTTVDAETRRALGLPLDAVERVIDTLRVAGEAEVALVLKQDDAGRWRVSTRSKGHIDVGRACRALGGGGHRFAAGATLDGSAETALADVRAALAASLEAG